MTIQGFNYGEQIFATAMQIFNYLRPLRNVLVL